MTRILNIVGCKNSGKTRTVEILVPRLQKLGLRVGTLKHTEHSGFRWDREGTDTFRHHTAGSEISGIFGSNSFAVDINRPDLKEPAVDEIVKLFYSEVDLVLVEGRRTHPSLKIEVCRPGYSDAPVVPSSELLATYGENLYGYDVPHFAYGREDLVADHILAQFDRLNMIE
jgi:molybdopterin-guanine dinucleotide biosynthesis adapter protein